MFRILHWLPLFVVPVTQYSELDMDKDDETSNTCQPPAFCFHTIGPSYRSKYWRLVMVRAIASDNSSVLSNCRLSM